MNDGPTYSIIWLVPIWAVIVVCVVLFAARVWKKGDE